MQEITLKLWRNDDEQDWSLEINGLRYEHVSAETLEDLAEAALSVAENSLMEAATRQPH
jgi:hypothetical protein